MEKHEVVRYTGARGLVTVSYFVMPGNEVPDNVVLSHALVYPEIIDHVQAGKLVYFGRDDCNPHSLYENMQQTPEWAIYGVVPWDAFLFWGKAPIVEVLDESTWNKVLYIRKQEEAEAAHHKAERARSEAARLEAERVEDEKYYNLMELGWSIAKRTKGTFVRRQGNGEPVRHEPETEGYLIVDRKTDKPLHFGVSGGTGMWRITHVPSGHYLAWVETLKDACAVVGAIHSMIPDVWSEKYPPERLTEVEQTEIKRFLMKYRENN